MNNSRRVNDRWVDDRWVDDNGNSRFGKDIVANPIKARFLMI